jgi:Protein of unknown function (DUF2804)
LIDESVRIPGVVPLIPGVVPPSLPWRGTFGEPRPSSLAGLPLPPGAMPSHFGTRPLKAWRYVGVYGPELMLCVAQVRIGVARQSFWAVWDRERRCLYQRTRIGGGGVRLRPGGASVVERSVRLELELSETAGIESVCPSGEAYAWTRKQGGIAARGTITLGGATRQIEGRAIVDDTAAFYPRVTRWRWSAGVGRSVDGRELAWNLVEGVNDPPIGSERTVWVDGEPHEVPPCSFAADLDRVDELHFAAEATRARRENLLLVRSDYRQPFGTFSGVLPGGIAVEEGYGVMEKHEARW